jgi:hypothetical protein
MWVRYLTWLVAILLLVGVAFPQGMGDRKGYDYLGTPVVSSDQVQGEDWINPYSAGTPEWDPYGPGQQPVLERPEWDPYGSTNYPYASGSSYGGLQLQHADPFNEKLTISDNVPYQNQLYVQRGPGLQSSGGVMLGETFALWAHVAGRGGFTLNDHGRTILTQGYLAPGWYRVVGLFADTIDPHQYQFASAGIFSNIVNVAVGNAGYPTSYSLTGRVVDQYGNGISGAKVMIMVSSGEGGYFSTKTDAFGYYGMDVATGAYIITADKPGYAFTQSGANVWTGSISAARRIIGYPQSGYSAEPGY